MTTYSYNLDIDGKIEKIEIEAESEDKAKDKLIEIAKNKVFDTLNDFVSNINKNTEGYQFKLSKK